MGLYLNSKSIIALLSVCVLFWGCGGEKPLAPPPPPESGGTVTFSVPYDAVDGKAMSVGYYIFGPDGKAVPYTDQAGKSRTLHLIEGQALSRNTKVTVETPSNGVPGCTVVAVASAVLTSQSGAVFNQNAQSVKDDMVTCSGGAAGEYFRGSALLDGDQKAEVSLERVTGRLTIALRGEQAAVDGVAEAEVLLAGDTYTGAQLCDGTLATAGTEGRVVLEPEGAWSSHAMPTAKDGVAGGVVRISYRRPGDSELRVAHAQLEARHNFTLRSNTQTTLTVTLQMNADGTLVPTLAVTTAWVDGPGGTTDESGGDQREFYYKFIKETTFPTAAAREGLELALYGDYFYIPVGAWTGANRTLDVAVWSITRGVQVGTIKTPVSSEVSFCYKIGSLRVIGDRLFVGHGLAEPAPGYGVPIARVDVFDLSQDPTVPGFVTSIGGSSYLPFQNDPWDNPWDDPYNIAKIGEPLAVYEKDGKLLVMDHFRLNVFNSSDLTPEKSGNMEQACFRPEDVEVDIGGGDFLTVNGELYITDPSKTTGVGGLRRVNWTAVEQGSGNGADLLDLSTTLLKGRPVAKVVAFDDGYFTFDGAGNMSRFDGEWNFAFDCNIFFYASNNTLSTTQLYNAIPLPVGDDGKQRLLMRDGVQKVLIVRIEKCYLSEF